MQARTHKVRLVLLWFATWKNGSNHYMPGWMKSDAEKYPNLSGRDGQPIDSPAPDAPATLQADIRAFTAVMRHLKQSDAQHTIIMIQVENEAGSWGSVRNFCSRPGKKHSKDRSLSSYCNLRSSPPCMYQLLQKAPGRKYSATGQMNIFMHGPWLAS